MKKARLGAERALLLRSRFSEKSEKVPLLIFEILIIFELKKLFNLIFSKIDLGIEFIPF